MNIRPSLSIKSRPWAINATLVAPGWSWFWLRPPVFMTPLWRNGGKPVEHFSNTSATQNGTPEWWHGIYGVERYGTGGLHDPEFDGWTITAVENAIGDQITIHALFRVDVSPDDSYAVVYFGDNLDDPAAMLGVNSSDQLHGRIYPGAFKERDGDTLTIGQYYSGFLVYDGANLWVQLGYSESAKTAASGNLSNKGPIRLGGRAAGNWGQGIQGSIVVASIWDYTLPYNNRCQIATDPTGFLCQAGYYMASIEEAGVPGIPEIMEVYRRPNPLLRM